MRNNLLDQFATMLYTAAQAGALGGSSIAIRAVNAISGPRAGALEVDAGLDSGRLLRALSADDGASVRQFIPWQFPMSPAVYMSGRFVRIEAGWPAELAERDITLDRLAAHPHGSGRWLAGKSEGGSAITLGVNDTTPHWLIAGTTGSGKSIALRSLIAQLSDRGDHLVLIDGKYGEGLRGLDHLPGVIGPTAADGDTARSALAWSADEMRRRYETGDTTGQRVVIFIDEIQEFSNDAATIELIRRIAAQGRAARVHLVIATQHPTAEALGDSTVKRNVTGRLALRVSDYKASEVAVGQNTPRADWLLGAGDAYAVVPGAAHRLQVAYLPAPAIERRCTAQPRLVDWPEFAAEVSLPDGWPGADELAHALACAAAGDGSRKYIARVKMSTGRAVKMLKLARAVLDAEPFGRAFDRKDTLDQTPAAAPATRSSVPRPPHARTKDQSK